MCVVNRVLEAASRKPLRGNTDKQPFVIELRAGLRQGSADSDQTYISKNHLESFALPSDKIFFWHFDILWS